MRSRQRRCSAGYELNPETGRCRKKCKRSEERNPKTGRCRKKCKRGEERNKSGRCVRSQQPPHRRRRFQKHPQPQLDRFLSNFGDSINVLMREFDIQQLRRVAAGAFGSFYEAQNEDGEWTTGFKFQKYRPDRRIRGEEEMHKRFQNLNLAPRLHHRIILRDNQGRNWDVLYTEKITNILDTIMKPKIVHEELDFVVDQILMILETMKAEKITHGDMHFGNLFYNPDEGRIQLIDFGWAFEGKALPRYELVQLLFGLCMDNSKKRGNPNATYLMEQLINNRRFPLDEEWKSIIRNAFRFKGCGRLMELRDKLFDRYLYPNWDAYTLTLFENQDISVEKSRAMKELSERGVFVHSPPRK